MRRSGSAAGFALMEVMVASAIFTIAAVGFARAYVTAIRTQTMAKNHYRATCIARNRIERARGTEFASMPMLAETDRRVNELGSADSTGGYLRTTTVDTNLPPNAVSVTVSVKYPDRMTVVSTTPITVSTLIYRGM